MRRIDPEEGLAVGAIDAAEGDLLSRELEG